MNKSTKSIILFAFLEAASVALLVLAFTGSRTSLLYYAGLFAATGAVSLINAMHKSGGGEAGDESKKKNNRAARIGITVALSLFTALFLSVFVFLCLKA